MQISEFNVPSTQDGIALEYFEHAVHRVEDKVTVCVRVLSLFRRREGSDRCHGQENGGEKLEKHFDGGYRVEVVLEEAGYLVLFALEHEEND